MVVDDSERPDVLLMVDENPVTGPVDELILLELALIAVLLEKVGEPVPLEALDG